MMVNENVNMVAETRKFMDALDSYYSLEPLRIYDFLLFFYFAKKGTLRYVENLLPEEQHDLVFAKEECDDDLSDFWQMWNELKNSENSLSPKMKNLMREAKNEVSCKNLYLRLLRESNKETSWTFNRAIVADFSDDDDKDEIKGIINSFNPLQSEMQESGCNELTLIDLKYIIDGLTSISKAWYSANVDFAFNEILRAIQKQKQAPKELGSYSHELAKFVTKLLNVKQGSLYEPFAGDGFLGTLLDDSVSYKGKVICYDMKPIAKLNLLLHSKNSRSVEYNPLSAWHEKQYDNIVMLPILSREPLKRLQAYNLYDFQHLEDEPKNMLIVAAESCNQKSVSVHFPSVCFSKEGVSLIKPLIDKDLMETVVLLPSNVLDGTYVQPLVFITNKDKQEKGIVRFVDASHCFEELSFHDKRFDMNWAVNLCASNDDKRYVVEVPTSEIIGNNYITYPLFYLNKKVECEDGKKLMSLGQCLKQLPIKYSNDKSGLFFSFNRSNYNAAEYIVKAEELQVRNMEGSQLRVVMEDCLLWTKFMKQFAYLKTSGKPVFVRPNFKAFKVNEEVITPQYLLSELYKDYFVEQLDRFGRNTFGGHGAYMSVDDFLNCKIQVPMSKLEQEKAVLDGQSVLLEERAASLEATYQKKFENFVLGQRQRKHAVAQVLNEIMPTVQNIKDFIDINESVNKNSVISQRSGKKLGEYLSVLVEQTNKVIGMVDRFTSQEAYAPAEKVDLYDFLPSYVKSKDVNEICSIEFCPDINDFKYQDYRMFFDEQRELKEDAHCFVNVSKKDLTQMLDNLIENAKAYGFGSRKEYGNEIMIAILSNHGANGTACIQVANNGELVSESIDLKKLFTWGIGKHTGIGCWQVRDIAEHFGGSVAYDEHLQSPYPCVFSIYLPLIEE